MPAPDDDIDLLLEAEWIVVSQAQDFLWRLPLSIQPAGEPCNEVTITLNEQNKYVQNRIKHNETALIEAWQMGVFSEMLEQCGLSEKHVSQSVVQKCLCELQIEHDFRRELFYRHHPEDEIFDPQALTIQEQAAERGLAIIKPNTQRGMYAGPMVAEDYRACLIKFANEMAVELPFWVLDGVQARPRLGDLVRLNFLQGEAIVSIGERVTKREK